jgi:hypothetical protein
MADTKSKTKKVREAGKSYRGTVDGIDVHAFGGQPVRCFAFVNQTENDYIQIVTYEARVQSALELASSKKCEVEVSYEDDGTYKIGFRVRLLDRQ